MQKNKRFVNQNPHARAEKGLLDALKWMLNRKQPSWPSFHLGRKTPILNDRLEPNQTSITFINHATALIQVPGVNILTDPVFSKRVSPLSWVGPKRVREPGLKISELPRIDYILLSHNHYDHLDIHALKEINHKWQPQLLCPLGNLEFFKKRKFENVVEMDWWQKVQVSPNLEFHLTPAQHWSSRSPFDRNRSLWGGFIVKSHELKIFFSGDTGYYQHFNEIFEKFGAIDVSLLPIGSYEPRWFMKDQHVNPREAVLAHQDLRSKLSIGIHFSCFQLADEAFDQPAKDLKIALDEFKVSPTSFLVPDHGESFNYQK